VYNLAHADYAEAGGINQTQWINLYNSFANNIIDHNNDSLHPGIESNKRYFTMIKDRLDRE
jgi:hypothetical protein